MSVFDLKNKKILVTGALGLIGRELCYRLIKNNNKLIMIDHNFKKKNSSFKIKSKKINVYDVDLSNPSEIKKFFKLNQKILKGFNTLVNLAAIDAKVKRGNEFDVFENFPIENLIKTFSVNVIGLICICQEACKFFLKNKIKGNIINVGSTYSLVAPNINLYNSSYKKKSNKPIDYVISKSVVPMLTKYLATNYASTIRCNCIIPHVIIKKPPKKFIKNFKKISPIQRTCKVEEIINPLIFLISDGSSYMNGSTTIVDGGWTAW